MSTMGDTNERIWEILKANLSVNHECDENTYCLCFFDIQELVESCPSGDTHTHTLSFATKFGNIDNFVEQCKISIVSGRWGCQLINDSANILIIPLSYFIDKDGHVRDNTVTFTNTSSINGFCCGSGWLDYGIQAYIRDNNDNVIFDYSKEARGINGDDIGDDVFHTRYSIIIDRDEIVDLYKLGLDNLGKGFDYWSL